MGSVSQKIPKQGDIWWVNLDPTVGKEINKKRPCVVVSPNETNKHLGACIVAPVTSTLREWPTRVEITLQKQQSSVALDQIRMIDNSRLIRRITTSDAKPMLAILREMFE
jgi:mRNA interferase MazF